MPHDGLTPDTPTGRCAVPGVSSMTAISLASTSAARLMLEARRADGGSTGSAWAGSAWGATADAIWVRALSDRLTATGCAAAASWARRPSAAGWSSDAVSLVFRWLMSLYRGRWSRKLGTCLWARHVTYAVLDPNPAPHVARMP